MADSITTHDVATGQTVTRQLTAAEQAERDARVAARLQQDAAEAAIATNETTVASQLDTALDAMRTHVQRGTFTAAQRDNALLLVLRVCIGLVRLARRRLDGTD